MGLLILTIIFMIGGFVFFKRILNDGVFGVFIGLIFSIFISAFIIIILVLLEQPIGEPYEEVQYKIQGLENNITTTQNTSGTFILGCGYIESESKETLKYYYFKINDIGKQLESIEINDNSNIYIRETDDVEPCLIYRHQKMKYPKFYEWFIGGTCETTTITAEILVVPTNTIKIEYNIDI